MPEKIRFDQEVEPSEVWVCPECGADFENKPDCVQHEIDEHDLNFPELVAQHVRRSR